MHATVAVVGLGKMGSVLAERLLLLNRPTLVFNRTDARVPALLEQGAIRLSAGSDALIEADCCITALADDDAFLEVVLGEQGIVAHARSNTVLIDTSTVSVAASEQAAKAAAAARVVYLRAPISGNPDAIRSGRAAMFVSGAWEGFLRVKPLLEAMVATVSFVGEDEQSRVVKLALQVLIGGTAELLAEAVSLAESCGVERAAMLAILEASVVGSTFISYKGPPIVSEDYSPTFTTAMMAKDIRLILALAECNAIDLPFTAQLEGLLTEASASGYADDDFISLIRLRTQGRSG